MPHDEHFLQRLDRVTREQVEFALGLYRDHEAVAHLLRQSKVAADGPARVALAIADGGRGPHVIVAPDGAFVTCLGEGMSPAPWPVLSRAKVDGLLKQLAEHRRRRQAVVQIARPGEDLSDLFARLATRKNLLAREELTGLSAFAPLFARGLYLLTVESCAEIHQGSQKVLSFTKGPKAADFTDLHARVVWSAAYGMELCGVAGRHAFPELIPLLAELTTFSMPTTLLVDHTFLLRGVWAAGKIGKSLIPSYRWRLEHAEDLLTILDAVLGLTTIALRHSNTAPEVLRLFHRLSATADGSAGAKARAEAARRSIVVVENDEELLDASRVLGADAHARASRARLDPDDPDRIEPGTEVPADLAETAYLMTHGALTDDLHAPTHLFGACPLLARIPAEAFHYPAALVRKLVPPWGAAEATRHNAQMRSVTGRREPVAYAARFGRNDPCPCGSGKKFKKCCLP